MKTIEVDAYKAWRAKNTDPYGDECFVFAENWADEMEQAMSDGKPLEAVAEAASSIADKKSGGITGFMYGMAVAILAKHWEFGEGLRRWHNLKTQIRDEGERANESGAVLNPALLSIGAKDEP